MSLSLRDQLLKAGLVTEQQVQKAEREQNQKAHRHVRDGKQKPRDQRRQGPTPQQVAAQKAAAEKAARDAELNRKKQEKAERKAKFAEIKQLVQQHQVARVETDDFYNFQDGVNIRRVPVTPEQRTKLVAGDLAIVRNEGRYAFVPAATAAEIRQRVERAVIHHNVPKDASADADDPYKDYVVPDDLVW